MRRQLLVLLFVFGFCATALSQVNAPCGLDYGTSSDESNISMQMRYGTILDAIAAIDQGKTSRGIFLGCPQVEITYATPDFTEPSLSEIENVWNTNHVSEITSYTVSCPRIGRYESNSALGAYYAMQAEYFSNTSILADIANMMYDQQYTEWNINSPNSRNEGVFAFVNRSDTDECYLGGVVGSGVSQICSNLPQYCVTYTGGQFAGESFATSGQDDDNEWFDGGLAYDHGWVGVQMIEASIQQTDDLLKQKYRQSVLLAGDYALSEYCVKNHNYTAKLIWLLSELYAWTGDTQYADELNYKLDKNLLPGILWDGNNDGFVDGTSPNIAFADLTEIAQTPGRMWDAHNSISWYHAMNTWALLEAYVAFRDQGETSRASELKPYVIAMLDNLANEINTQGVISPNQLGARDISYALLLGIWKLSQYENEDHQNWENAAWAMWNTGYFNDYSTHSVCVGLYLIIRTETPYIPLHLREDFYLKNTEYQIESLNIEVFPNPAREKISVRVISKEKESPIILKISSIDNKIIARKQLLGNMEIDIKHLTEGLYFLHFYQGDHLIWSEKLIKI